MKSLISASGAAALAPCGSARTKRQKTKKSRLRLPSNIVRHLQHFIGRLNRLRIGLISPLTDDQVDHLLHDIHIRHLEVALEDSPQSILPRRSRGGVAACFGLFVEVLPLGAQAADIGERVEKNVSYLLGRH